MSGFGSSSDEDDDEEQESEEDVNNEVSYPLQRCPSRHSVGAAALLGRLPRDTQGAFGNPSAFLALSDLMSRFRMRTFSRNVAVARADKTGESGDQPRSGSHPGRWVRPRVVRGPIDDDSDEEQAGDHQTELLPGSSGGQGERSKSGTSNVQAGVCLSDCCYCAGLKCRRFCVAAFLTLNLCVSDCFSGLSL